MNGGRYTSVHSLSLQPHSIHIAFTVPSEHRIPADPWGTGFSETQNQDKGLTLCSTADLLSFKMTIIEDKKQHEMWNWIRNRQENI